MIKTQYVMGAILLGLLVSSKIVAAPLDSLFPDARVVYQSSEVIDKYVVTLGTLKRINAQLVAEKETVVQGLVNKKTIELNAIYSADSAQRDIEQAIKSYENRLLFACDGLSCGSSNAWANDRFEIKLLFGKDQTQAYRVWELVLSGDRYLVATYTVQRGNRKVYAQIESVKLAKPSQGKELISSPKAILKRLDSYGFFVFEGAQFNNETVIFNKPQVEALVSALEREPFLRFSIVGHDFSVGDQASRLQRSLAYAAALKLELEGYGIKENRIKVEGVGGLAPNNEKRTAKLVLIKD